MCKINPDDKTNSITVEANTKDSILLIRTVIQPPSFVTYTRDLTELEKQKQKEKEIKMQSEINLEYKVQYADTDAYGVVWHGTYLRWMEAGRVEWLFSKGVELMN